MSTFHALLLTFFAFRSYGHISCPNNQEPDTHRICEIFKYTNIQSLPYFQNHNFSDGNYCDWGSLAIECDSMIMNDNKIRYIYMSGLTGPLDFTYRWPTYLEYLDLEQDLSQPSLNGAFNWTSLQSLNELYELDLEDNTFSNVITNNDWNIIASLPSLNNLDLEGNLIECNFSQINLTTNSNIQWLQLSNNNFYGTLTSQFINRFPYLSFFDVEENDLYGHFDNFNVFRNNKIIKLGHNHFTGTVTLSDNIHLSYDIITFRIDYNDFSGEINWNIFSEKYYLEEFDINNNAFTGTINWDILSDLHNNGNLTDIDLRDNKFIGYVDFSWLTDAVVAIEVDVNIHCDPQIYPCPNGSADRTRVFCDSKINCEATCQCIQTISVPTVSPITSFPTSVPTISPLINSIISTKITSYTVNVQHEHFSIVNTPYIIIIILTLVVIALCCIIIGFMIGCYCVSYRKRLHANKHRATNSIVMHKHTGGLPKLPTITSPTLPPLPKD
eukprot:23587_1